MRETKVIAIGGGSVRMPGRTPTTLLIDMEAIRLAGRELPVTRETVNVLFIPTASRDDLGYCMNIYEHFGLRLGCAYDHLRLYAERDTPVQISQKIAWADIIYVGGGNTRDMMAKWNETGVSDLLRQAYAAGKVMMGLSAGSICWFDGGLSDSNKFDGDPNWKPMWVPGLGFIPLLNSPHFDSEMWREEHLESQSIQVGFPQPVVAVEDNCAIEVVGGNYRVIASRPTARAYLYSGRQRRTLRPHEEFRPISELC